jgi:hypothetical protein
MHRKTVALLVDAFATVEQIEDLARFRITHEMSEGTIQESRVAPGPGPPQARPARKLHPDVVAQQKKDVRNLLLMFRFLNALCICTFFQPDEYFQALEPAWGLAFGPDSGAWMTWVNSSLNPFS